MHDILATPAPEAPLADPQDDARTHSGGPTTPSSTGSPWRDQDFRTLFGVATLNQLGTRTGHATVPLLALTALDAGPPRSAPSTRSPCRPSR
ncbi:hypothetical protein [Streptomyces erythrochromogenes]|uniref:hypothetical protein n=1 Tax=Streptomyces erythrochromogenes TaxID=285574 RepID=UPI003813F81A